MLLFCPSVSGARVLDMVYYLFSNTGVSFWGRYTVMLNCWTPNPDERPTFSTLIREVEHIVACLKGDHYINLNVTYVNLEQGQPFTPSISCVNELDFRGLSEEAATPVQA